MALTSFTDPGTIAATPRHLRRSQPHGPTEVVVNGAVVLRRAGGTARADASGRVAVTSLRDYVTLPADAKVAVALEVHGDGVTGVGAQGFLELRKL